MLCPWALFRETTILIFPLALAWLNGYATVVVRSNVGYVHVYYVYVYYVILCMYVCMYVSTCMYAHNSYIPQTEQHEPEG